MSAESDAYKAAEKAIAEALESGTKQLYLSDLTELSRLPPEIEHLTALRFLYLSDTQVTDITPLQRMTALQILSLSNTRVTDIAPLQGMTALQTLTLSNTQVTDITPLQGMTALEALNLTNMQVTDITALQGKTALRFLSLCNTQVTDIAPLQGMNALQILSLRRTHITDITPLQGMTAPQVLDLSNTQVLDLRPLSKLSFGNPTARDSETDGMQFENIPATNASPELSRLSLINDNEIRTRKTLAYLRTLPPWPQPLPWDKSPPSPEIPPEQPAPLRVVEIDGILRPANPGDDLDQAESRLAEQGWAALCDYLQDLADQRPRIHNTMPRLAKALDRLEVALGKDYDKMNPIAVGTQANRVIRLSTNAADMLMDEDAADITEFAAALALLIERFPDWRAYRAAALATPLAPETVEQSIPKFTDVVAAFLEHPEIDPDIAANLKQQIEATQEDPSDSITSTGLAKSLSNVLSALVIRAKPILGRIKSEIGDISGMSWTGLKKVISGSIVTSITSLAGAGLDIWLNNATLLKSLAAKFPEHLNWVLKFLNAFGL